MAKLTYEETCGAVELLMQVHPNGVTANQIWKNFFTKQCTQSQVRTTLLQLTRRGHLVRCVDDKNPGRSSFLYSPGEKYSGPDTLPRVLAPSARLVAAPTAPKSSLKEVNLKELRATLDKTIDALETIQDQLQPLLAKLLDLARDCDKLEQVRDIITGMKTMVV